MGEHDTWYTILMPEFWARLEGQPGADSVGLKEALGREWTWQAFQGTHFTLVHVGSALIAALFILFCTLRYRATLNDATGGVVPPKRWTLGAMIGNFVHAVYDLCVDVLGKKQAVRYLPLIGTFALFIFCNNIQGLIPGFLPGTDTLKTNLFLSVLIFAVYNVVGIIEQGPFRYFAHFCGPSFPIGGVRFPWLFWLMLPVEIFSHIGRPVSLAMRLMGNMIADHKVVGVMMFLVPAFIPVPFLLLGTLVSILQTLVFTALATIYISEAIGHGEAH